MYDFAFFGATAGHFATDSYSTYYCFCYTHLKAKLAWRVGQLRAPSYGNRYSSLVSFSKPTRYRRHLVYCSHNASPGGGQTAGSHAAMANQSVVALPGSVKTLILAVPSPLSTVRIVPDLPVHAALNASFSTSMAMPAASHHRSRCSSHDTMRRGVVGTAPGGDRHGTGG